MIPQAGKMKSAEVRSPTSEPGDPASMLERLEAFFPASRRIAIHEDHLLSVLSVRRGREDLFGSHLISGPAWDVILELYAARLGERRVSPSELARAISVPEPVILRRIEALFDCGIGRMVGRMNDSRSSLPRTGRRKWPS